MAAKQAPLQELQQKKGEKRKEGQKSDPITNRSTPLRFLRSVALIHLGCCGLSGCSDRGAPGVHEELWWERVEGVGHPIWNLWLVSTDVVFERTTPVNIGEDHLQGLLVVLLHGLLVLARLGFKGRHFILSRLDIQ